MRSSAGMKGNVKIEAPIDSMSPPPGRFGTFGGVFTPSILTILGVVMYMRVGWVVGQQGLGGALLIIGVAHMISIATGLSIASIATNRTVGAGGAYFMISRSLGAPAGAAIGFPLFLGQALGVTFYIVGFTEALTGLSFFAWLRDPIVGIITGEKIVGMVVLIGLTYLSIKSAELAIKAQYVVMVVIVLSLISFFLGTGSAPPEKIVWTNPHGLPFTTVFAVFFPAVTGIMAGVSMSGDLKDPRKAIPGGTLMAILVGMIIYIAFPIWLAIQASTQQLTDDLRVVWDIAYVPFLIDLGVWAACLSSALASIMTAPRTLQALAGDGHAPRIFSRGFGENHEPVAGIIMTFVLAGAGIIMGNLDVIAPVLTMFFLVTYGFTNLACGLERWAASPSFRPDFKVPASISLFGAFSCFYVMSIINMGAMFAAMSVVGAIYAITQRRVLGTTYGDARHGIWSAMVRSSLQRLRDVEFHPLNWRPNLLILGGDVDRRTYLLRLGSAIVQERGIVSFAHLLVGEVTEHAKDRKDMIRRIGSQIADEFPNVFYRVDIVPKLYPGIVTLAQGYGVGSLEANCVMLGWPHKKDRRAAFVSMLQDLVVLDKSVLLVNHKGAQHVGQARQKKHKEIHVWWGGLEGNGGLMLLLAFLLTSDHTLRNARVRVMTVVNDDEHEKEAAASIEHIITAARLQARSHVIMREGREIADIIGTESSGADLAILGFRMPTASDEASTDAFFDRMNRMLDELPTTIMVNGARDFESEPVLFDN